MCKTHRCGESEMSYLKKDFDSDPRSGEITPI